MRRIGSLVTVDDITLVVDAIQQVMHRQGIHQGAPLAQHVMGAAEFVLFGCLFTVNL
jgi:hypothetical protein